MRDLSTWGKKTVCGNHWHLAAPSVNKLVAQTGNELRGRCPLTVPKALALIPNTTKLKKGLQVWW